MKVLQRLEDLNSKKITQDEFLAEVQKALPHLLQAAKLLGSIREEAPDLSEPLQREILRTLRALR